MTGNHVSAFDLLGARIRLLESQILASLDDGQSPDSYNVGWLEGARHELAAVLEQLRSRRDNV